MPEAFDVTRSWFADFGRPGALWGGLMAVHLGCTGMVHDRSSDPMTGSDPDTDSSGQPLRPPTTNTARPSTDAMAAGRPMDSGMPPGPPPPPSGARPAAPGFRRLTSDQIANAFRDLLGNVPLPEFEADIVHEGFTSVGASEAGTSARFVEQYELGVREAVRFVIEDSARRTALLPCTPVGIADETCARRFVQQFGRRAWRRPLTVPETDWLVKLAVEGGKKLADGSRGLGLALSALLQSPKFLFRVERGEPVPGGRLRFTAHEMATRLSFAIWDAPPDVELLDAADTGDLLTDAGLRKQADRLAASPRLRGSALALFDDVFEIPKLPALAKDAVLFKTFTESIRNSLAEASRRLTGLIAVERRSDLRGLLETSETYVNPEVSKLYGLPALKSAGLELTRFSDTDPRSGLGILGQATFLALHATAQESSPTTRGRAIQERLRCAEVPNPPPGVSQTFPVDDGVPRLRRQKLEIHRTDPSCAGCHAVMDPLGLAFENFDAVGSYRAREHGMAIDTTGSLDGQAFSGPREVADLVRKSEAFSACLVKSVVRHSTGFIEGPADETWIKTLRVGFDGQGRRFDRLLVDVVTSDRFRFTTPAL